MASNKRTAFWTKGTLKMHLLTNKGSQFTPAILQGQFYSHPCPLINKQFAQ